jgi:hypothetical protein
MEVRMVAFTFFKQGFQIKFLTLALNLFICDKFFPIFIRLTKLQINIDGTFYKIC